MENSSIVIFSAPSLHNYWRGAPPPGPSPSYGPARGRANTEVFKYDDVLPRLPHIRFQNATYGCSFFLKYGEKNLHFRKYPATSWWSNTIRKRYMWTQFFLNTEIE